MQDSIAALETDAALHAKEYGNWVQDTMAALEVDAALHAKGPELMSGLLQRRKLAMIFRLWDPQARGCVNRAAIAAVLEFYYRQGWPAASQPSLLHYIREHAWVSCCCAYGRGHRHRDRHDAHAHTIAVTQN